MNSMVRDITLRRGPHGHPSCWSRGHRKDDSCTAFWCRGLDMCVLQLKVNRLIEEIGKYIPKADGESIGTAGELIGERIKNKRFLLVLDDVWDCGCED